MLETVNGIFDYFIHPIFIPPPDGPPLLMGSSSLSNWLCAPLLLSLFRGFGAAAQSYLDRPTNERDDINIVDHKGRTALHHACLCVVNTPDLVLLLLRRGAYIHALTDKNYLTPLHCACVKGSLDAARVLIRYGADLLAQTADGKTPFKMLPPTSDNKKFIKCE